MNEQSSKYLRNARAAREENNSEDAKKFYDMVRTEDPENGEAKFFISITVFTREKTVKSPQDLRIL